MVLTEITITYSLARRMASIAEAATEPAIRGALTRDHRNAIHAVARRLVSDGGAPGLAGALGAADPDATLATLGLDDETFRTYLDPLDTVATTTATPTTARPARTCSPASSTRSTSTPKASTSSASRPSNPNRRRASSGDERRQTARLP